MTHHVQKFHQILNYQNKDNFNLKKYNIFNTGLDVHPQTRLRFANQKDQESVKLLDILYEDEITHVAAGIKWFQFTCQKNGIVNS